MVPEILVPLLIFHMSRARYYSVFPLFLICAMEIRVKIILLFLGELNE